MSKNALVCFLYNDAVKYFDSLIYCINSQTTKNFEIIFFNDNIVNLEGKLKNIEVPYRIFDVKSNCLLEIRFEGLKILLQLDFDSYIFQDCDDLFSNNRVELSLKLLKKYSLVVTDLDIIDENDNLLHSRIWSRRFEANHEFSCKDIQNFNFVGLGNTSISKKILKFIPNIPSEKIKAIDWYLFYSILSKSKAIGYFTSECSVKYRQHNNNTIGIQNTLKVQDILFTKMQINKLLDLDTEDLNASHFKLPENTVNKYPFWWELNYVKNENT